MEIEVPDSGRAAVRSVVRLMPQAVTGGAVAHRGRYTLTDVDECQHRPVQQAVLAGAVWQHGSNETLHYGGSHVVVLDVESGSFARLPFPNGEGRLLGLSADGRQLLLMASQTTPPYPNMRWLDELCVYDLATGRQRWFPALVDGRTEIGALSPDGRTIATLAVAEDPDDPDDDVGGLAIVSLTDVNTGTSHRLWAAARAGISAESTLSWSPDSQLIAVTYSIWVEERDDEWSQSAVIDRTGQVLWCSLDFELPSASNGAWLSERQIVACAGQGDRDLYVIDALSGERRRAGQYKGIPIAVAATRMLRYPSELLGEDLNTIVSSDLDLSKPCPLLTAAASLRLEQLDVARDTLTPLLTPEH